MKYIPEYILTGDYWVENQDKLSFEDEPLFITNASRVKVFNGDSYWTFPDDRRTQGNRVIANKKWDYSDDKPRFKTKEEMQDAIKVYEWLNEGINPVE
jgi:hypothetical protein